MQSKHSALSVVARLVGMVVAVAVLAGEFVSSYAASPTLFGQEVGAAQLPAGGLVAPALAVLFFSLCAVFGICALEAWEWVPAEVWVFNVPQSRRGAFRWFAALSLAASVVAMTLFYAERTFYLLDPAGDITLALQIATFVLLGLLVGLAGLVALWMVVVGLQALVQVVLVPVVGVGRLRRRQSARRSERGEVIPAHSTEIGDGSMNQQCVGLYYGGAFGLQMRAIMEPTMRRLHADHLVGSSGLVSLDRLAEPGVVGQDVSPSRADQARILSGAADPEQGYTEIFKRLGAAVFDANVGLPSIGASLWFFLDPEVLPYTVDMLRTVRRQLPYHAIAVVTQLDEGDRESDVTRNGLRSLRELWEEGVVATTFVLSARSAFTMTVKHSGGEVKQMEFLAQTLTALLLAESQSHLNRSCVEILRALGRLSPFASCAFASGRLTPLRATGLGRVRQWLRRDEQEVGHEDDLRAQTEHVARQVLTEQEYRATRAEIPPDRRALLVCTIPLRWTDRRFGMVQEALMTFLARSFPSVASIMMRGNGVPMGIAADPLDRWYVQASCVYPIPPGFFEEVAAELDAAQGQQARLAAEEAAVIARDRSGRFIAEPKAGALPPSNGTGKPRVRP